MFCGNCGDLLTKATLQCPNCGHEVVIQAKTTQNLPNGNTPGLISELDTNTPGTSRAGSWTDQTSLSSQSLAPATSIVRKRGLRGLGLAAALALIAAIGIGSIAIQGNIQKQEDFEAMKEEIETYFSKAATACGASTSGGVLTGPDYLTIDTMGEEEYYGATFDDLVCIVGATGVPEWIQTSMWGTSALMGTVSESWSPGLADAEITASWSYHPDTGMTLVMNLDSNYLTAESYQDLD